MGFTTLQIGQALLARALFLGHSLLAVAHTANVLGDPLWWLLALANVGLLLETTYTLVERTGQDFRWISPSALWYLLATVPAICLLELDKLDRQYSANSASNNVSSNDTRHNVSSLLRDNATESVDLQRTFDLELVGEVFGVSLRLSADMWVEVIEQFLLLLLIVGRWLMPKGEISRDELSQLLFVYIAIASDIMELFELFNEEQVYQNEVLRYVILAVWGVSLFQFALVFIASHNPKRARATGSVRNSRNKSKRSSNKHEKVRCIDILSLLTPLVMMDGPFLAIRLYCLISLKLITYNIIFFTCKNLLVVTLLFYRLVIILLHK